MKKAMILLVAWSHSVTWLGTASPALAETPSLVGDPDAVGFSLDNDWGKWWRRIFDRHGRFDPVGPIQQRFPRVQRPEHVEDQAVSDYALSDELKWARAERGARWWVHSYDALNLGTQVQLKVGGAFSEAWRVGMRFDRLYTRSAESDLVQGDFTWMPDTKRGPYARISYFPRIEKQDDDVGLTAGYQDPSYGHAQLRLFALDTFSNGSFALANSRDADDGQAVTRQTSLPLALAVEASSVRLSDVRGELYAGAVVPQSREVHTESFSHVAEQEESGLLFGGLLEYRVPRYPLWVGLSGMGFMTTWENQDRDDASTLLEIDEQTYQSRLYLLAALRSNLRVETQVRYTARPEQQSSLEAGHTVRRDHEVMYHVRTQWLMSTHVGTDLSFWRTWRESEGPPDVEVDGNLVRFDFRCLLKFQRLIATFGVGFDPGPGPRSIYAGGGGNMVVLFD